MHDALTRAQHANYAATKRAVIAVLELHEFDSEDVACGNPRHTNFDVGCPDCYYPCQGCGESYPCPTFQAIEKELDRHARRN